MFTTLATGDEAVDRVQERIAEEFARLDEEINSDIVTVTLGVTAVAVPHGLGQVPKGRVIVGQSADARIWDGAASTTPKATFNMQASATVVVKLRFF